MKTSAKPGFAKVCAVAMMLLTYSDAYVIGAPRGGHVVSGTASFTQDGNLTVITAGNRSIINYQSFNVGSNEIVRFVQPGSGASVLNRVTSPDPTNIFGQIQANGTVYIVNPYGVFFQNGAVLNVGSLYAGAGKISNADFTSGNIHFTDLTGDVRNDGVIAANDRIALLGANVANNGTLSSAHGLATMVSGSDVYVGQRNSNIFVQANGGAAAPVSAGSITNHGTVAAPRILLGAGDLYSTAIVNSGLLQGRSIAVDAGRNGSAKIGGRLDASSARNPTATGTGGQIQVLGGQVALQGATLDASGANGGGSVRVGGDFHGGSSLAAAATTTVDAATTIKADATGAGGNGGTVVLWSNQTTDFTGLVTARGGSGGGNGGQVEISSRDLLGFTGRVDATGLAGKSGSLLLDPANILIEATGVSSGDTSVMLQATLEAESTMANITVTATNDLRIGTLLGNSLTFAPAASAGTLTLDANGGSAGAGNGTFIALAGDTIVTGGRALTIVAGATPSDLNTEAYGIQLGPVNAGSGAITLQTDGAINLAGAITGGSLATTNGPAGTGSVNITGGSVTTNAGQSYAQPVILGSAATPATTTLTDTGGGTITFTGSVTGLSTAAPQALALSTTVASAALPGTIVFGGFVGSAPTPLKSLSTTGGAMVDLNGGAVTTSGGGQSYSGTVLLGVTPASATAPAITSLSDLSGGAITLAAVTAGSSGTQALSLSTTGTMTLGGAVGTTAAPLASLTAGGGPVALNGATINTTGNQTLTGAALLGAGTILTSSGGGTIALEAVNGPETLSLSSTAAGGQVQLNGPIGVATTLTSLDVTAGAISLSGSTVKTSGAQDYAGPVTLLNPIDLVSASGAISADSLVGNSHDLTVNGLTTSFGTITIGGNLNFTVQAGVGAVFSGPVTATSLTVTGGATSLNGGSVTTDSATGQSYGGSVSLGLNTTLTDKGAGNITFSGLVDGAGPGTQSLAVLTDGITVFDGAVGSMNPLSSLAVSGFSAATAGSTLLNVVGGTSVATYANTGTGAQTYSNALVLGQGTLLQSTFGGAGTAGGDVTFGSTVNSFSATQRLLTVNTSGNEIFNGLVGNTFPLSGMVTDSAGTVGGQTQFNMSVAGQPTGVAGVRVGTGGLTINDAVVFNVAGSSSAAVPVAVSGGTGTNNPSVASGGPQDYAAATTPAQELADTVLQGTSLTLADGLNAMNHALTLDLSQLVTVPGAGFSNVNSFASVGSGGTQLTGSIATLGYQYYGNAATITNDLTLSSSGGKVIEFDSTLDGPHNLIVNTAGNEVFNGIVGGVSPLASLTTDNGGSLGGAANFGMNVTGLAAGKAGVSAGTVTINDAAQINVTGTVAGTSATAVSSVLSSVQQIYHGAVTLGADSVLMDGGNGITFTSTLNGPHNLTLNTTGRDVFGGPVGASNPLLSLNAKAGVAIDLNGNTVLTGGAGGQVYDGAVLLDGSLTPPVTTLTANNGGVITFAGTVNGSGAAVPQGLSLATTGAITFVQPVGGSTPLLSLATTAAGIVHINGGSVTTVGGGQTYTGPVVLGATGTPAMPGTTTLADDASGAITFLGTVDGVSTGTQALAVDTLGNETFGGVVGSTPLASLTTDLLGSTGGQARINTTSITTTGAQTYNDAVVLGSNTKLTGTTLTLEAGLNGSPAAGTFYSLTLDFSNPVTITGAIVGLGNFASVGTGGTHLDGAFTTRGFQSYQNAVLLTGTSALTASGAITFTSTLDGGFALATSSPGQTTFNGVVGGMAPLLSLTTGGTGSTALDGGVINTQGLQTYGNAVTLGRDTGLNSQNSAADGGAITFASTVDGTHNLALNTPGNEVFDGRVGSLLPLLSLSTDASIAPGGATIFNANSSAGPTVSTVNNVAPGGAATGGQTYHDAVQLEQGTVLLSEFTGAATTGGAVVFDGTVDSFGATAENLTVTAGVGQTVIGPGAAFHVAGINLGGAQVAFNAPVGATNPLNILTVAHNGAVAGVTPTIDINNGGFSTSLGQTYSDPVILSANTLLADTNAQAILFERSVNGDGVLGRTLTLNTAGTVTFDGTIGDGTPLQSLVVATGGGTFFDLTASAGAGIYVGTGGIDIEGPATFNVGGVSLANLTHPTVTTSGAQTYDGDVTLSQNTSLYGSAGGTIELNGSVNGGAGLALNTTGNEIFAGAVGGVSPLTSLAVDTLLPTAGGQTQFVMTPAAGVAGVRVGSGGVTIDDAVLFGAAGSTLAAPTVLTFNGGTQTYAGAATIGTNAVLVGDASGAVPAGGVYSGGGAILFGATVTGAGAPNLSIFTGAGTTTFQSTVGVNALTVTGARTTFDGAISGLNVLTIAPNAGVAGGPIDLNGGVAGGNTVTTAAGQTYGSPVVLGANTLLADTGAANITFTSAATVDGAYALTLATAGQTIFNALVGSNAALTSLTSNNAAGTTLLNMNVGTATAGVLVAGPVLLDGPAIFNTAGASLAHPSVLTLNNAAQTYGGAVSLAANTFLVSAAGLPAPGGAFAGGGAIAFTSAAGIASNGGQNLSVRAGGGTATFASTINVGSEDLGGANATFDGPINLPGLLSVEPNGGGSGGTIVLSGGGLTTAGAQTYNAAIILGANTVLTSLNTAGDGGNIVFTSTVNSGSAALRSLTVNTSGDEIFDGIVGGTKALASLTTDATGPVGGATRFNMNIGGASAGVAGVNVAGAVTINDQVIFNVAGTSLAAGGPLTISSGGAQTYARAAVLTLDTALASANTAGDGGNITFAATVDSGSTANRGLNVNTPGSEVFGGIVGGGNKLTSLTTDIGGNLGGLARFNMDVTNAPAGVAGINVLGAVTIDDAVAFNVAGSSLAAGGPVSVSTGGAQTYQGAASLTRDTALASTSGGVLTFNATVDGPHGLALSSSGDQIFNGLVGSAAALTSLTTKGGATQFNISLAGMPAAPAGVSVDGPVTINGPVLFHVLGSSSTQPSVLTAGAFAQTYSDAVTLAAGTVLASKGAGDLLFDSTVDGGFALTLTSAGMTTFNQPVGAGSALLSLATTNPAGSTVLNGGSIHTLEAQTFAGPVELTAGAILTSQNMGGLGTVTFNQTVNGPYALTVNTAGNTVFNGAIGNLASGALSSLTTDAPGLTILHGGSVLTTGAQNYGDPVLLKTGARLTSSGGTILFAQTVDANGNDALNLSAPGQIIFDGVVGATHLGSLTIAAGGTTELNGSLITTSGLQTYGNTVALEKPTVLTSRNAGAVTFDGSVDGHFALTIDTAAVTTFNGPVGGTQALLSLTTGAQGMVTFSNGVVDTTDAQTYGGPVNLQADADFTSTGGSVSFRQTVSGLHALTVNSGDETVFDGNVSQLTSLITAGAGTTEFSGGNVSIPGSQTYGQPVALNAGTSLAGSAVTFNKTVAGPFALTLNASGDTTFNAAVTLASLTTGTAGTTVLDIAPGGSSVTTTDFQSYGNAVKLAAGTTTLTSTNAITFLQTVDGTSAGANALALNSGGNALQGNVGVATPLSTLTVAGALSVGGQTVQTAGDQHYEAAVTLAPLAPSMTQMLSQSGNLRFDAAVTSPQGGLLAEGRRIFTQGDVTTAQDLDLETKAAGSGASPAPLLLLAGMDYRSSGGKVLFNTSGDSTPSSSADFSTIVLSNPGKVTIQGTGFTMGLLQKMLALGSVDIDVGHGVARVGDIAARDNLQISAGEVALLNRPMEPSQDGRPNAGLNFVAGQSINFGGASIVFAEAENRTANFITTNSQITLQRIFGISLFKDPTLANQFPAASAFNAGDFAQVDNPPQPAGGGAQSLDTAAALSGALPDQKPIDVAVDITISASQMEELKKLGIHPRLAKGTERSSLASKRALFAQLVDGQDVDNYGLLQPVKGGVSRLQPSDYVVVVDRMGEREVQSILAAFEELYGKDKEKAPVIGAAFQSAFTDYTVQKQTADPAGFSPFLQSQPGKYPAVETAVRGFDNLFGHIEHLGLTDKEVAKSEEHIASDLGVSGVSSEDMVKVINTLRQKLPPAQKAKSDSAPPSAPVGNPAPGATAPAPAAPDKKPTPPLKTAGQPEIYPHEVAQR